MSENNAEKSTKLCVMLLKGFFLFFNCSLCRKVSTDKLLQLKWDEENKA